MTILDFVRLTRHNLAVLALGMLLGLLVGVGVSLLEPTLYRATATGYVTAGSSDSVGSASASQSLASRKAVAFQPLVNSAAVAEGIAVDLAPKYPQGIRVGSMVGVALADSNLLRITVTAPTPTEARDLADAAMRATAVEALRLESMQPDGSSTGESVVRLLPNEAAKLPTVPVSPMWGRNLPTGLAGGLVLGYLAALVRRSVDARVRTQDDVEELTHGSVLGIIPRSDELSVTKGSNQAESSGPTAEALRQLRTNLRFVSIDRPPRVMVLTSPNPGEGKSTVAINLARLLAEAGQQVVLVDADLRRPTQAARLDLDKSVGLTQALTGQLALADVLQPAGVEGLRLLGAGSTPPNPSELVGSQRMRHLIETLAHEAIVLIDAPPLLPVTDAGLLAAASDGLILVLASGRTHMEQVRQSMRLLGHVKATLLGSVINLTPRRQLGSATYGYGYGGTLGEYAYTARRGSRRVRGRPRRSQPGD